MNVFWTSMMLFGCLVLLISNPAIVLQEMLGASADALSLCVQLCSVYAIWLGLLEIVEACGLGEKLSRLLQPLIKKLFKTKDAETEKLIALNLSANMLGLGNASTPMGIKAMNALDDHSGIATFGMIMLIVINTTSIQLFPTTVIGLRSAAGSTNPADIILPTLITTFFTTLCGIVLVFACDKIKSKKNKQLSFKNKSEKSGGSK